MIDHLQTLGGWILLFPIAMTFLAALVQRATGFGFGFIAGAGALTVFDPIVAVFYTGVANMTVSVVGTWQLRKDVDRRVSCILIMWMCLGIVLGLAAIGVAQRWWLQALALSVTFWAVFESVQAILKRRKEAKTSVNSPPAIKATVLSASMPGILSGFLGTCLGIPGPPIIGYFMKLGMSPFVIRASLLLIFAFISTVRVPLFPLLFDMPSFSFGVLALLLFATFLGGVAGAFAGRLTPAHAFAYINIAALSGSGAVLSVALGLHFFG